MSVVIPRIFIYLWLESKQLPHVTRMYGIIFHTGYVLSILYSIDVLQVPIEKGDFIRNIIRLIDTSIPKDNKYFIAVLRVSFFSALYTANGIYVGQSVNAKIKKIYPKIKLI